MKSSKPLLALSCLILFIGVVVLFLTNRHGDRQAPTEPSQTSQQDESDNQSPENSALVAESGLQDDDSPASAAPDETQDLLLPSEVVGQVFPKVNLDDLASRLPAEEFAVYERKREEFPKVDWTEIEPTHQSFLQKRAEFPLNLDDPEREAYAKWIADVEPMIRSLIRLRAEEHGLSVGGMEDERGYYLEGFRDGEPVYVVTANVTAATTTGVSYVRWNPGFDPALGDTINGDGIYVNVNDHGEIYEHTEFQLPDSGGSRILVKEIPGYSGGNRNHMTHVAGTMAAWGYDPNLEGMAPRSWIRSLIQQSTSDITTYGMATPGQEMGIVNPRTGNPQLRSMVGNTSLGASSPNNRYNSTSASYDTVLRDHPYYMHFYSSGNSGSHGYESLTGSSKVAKNMIGIGNASAATRDADGVYTGGGNIAGSSSRGPTYDGRINPDFVGKGTGVRSTVNENGSRTMSGTSMASPNVAGSVALLMDYVRKRLPQEYLRSSTYRALLATTADDRGNPGPDYIYGWGILNIHAAAEIIREQAENPSRPLIVENSLAPGQTWSEDYVSDGTEPIRVTIAWLDPASPNTDANSRASRIVNDLDLRLIGPGDAEHEPYVMPFTTGQDATPAFDPSLYDAHAVAGDNFTDPVEQVYLAAPVAGIYTVQVTHKGNLLDNEAQPFSVAVSGFDGPGGLVFSPENYSVDEGLASVSVAVARIGGSAGEASVNYATSDGSALAGSDYGATSGTLNWADGDDASKTIDVSIINDSVSETFEEFFTINLSNATGAIISSGSSARVTIFDDEPGMGVTSPNGGESLNGGSSYDITWVSGQGGNVSIELLKNDLLYTTISSSTANDGSFGWTIPAFMPDGSDYRIRIISLVGGQTDLSNQDFSIITVIPPLFTFDFESGLEGWIQDVADDFDWRRNSGGTTSNDTGPSAASQGSWYLYTEASSPNHPSKVANIWQSFDFSDLREPVIEFDYHMYSAGGYMGTLYLEVSTDNGASWDNPVAWSQSGNQGNAWNSELVDLSAYAGQSNVRLRFRGVTGSDDVAGWQSDMSLDNISITDVARDGIQFSSSSFLTQENVGSATITVARVGNTSGAVSVNYATSDGTAVAGFDYTATSGTLNWADGDGTAKTINIPLTNDSEHEDFLETIQVTLTNTVGAAILAPNPVTLNIQDDDNNPPDVNAGTDQTVYLSEMIPWSPADFGPALWLDADEADTLILNGSAVEEWRDKSGNDRHASQGSSTNQPTATSSGLNGKQVLTFDGSSDFLNVDLDFLAGQSHSAFIVLSGVSDYTDIYGAANGSSGANSLHVGFRNNSSYRMNYWSHDWYGAISSNFDATGSILNYVWDVGSPKEIFANGYLEDTSGGQNAAAIGTMSGGGRISNVVGHGYLGAEIAEIIIVTGTVSTDDQERFEGYLAHKWGLTDNLPVDHPYKSAPPGGVGMIAEVILDDATATDADGDVLTTDWNLFDGPNVVTFGDETELNTTVSFTQSGVYTLRLAGDDGRDPRTDDVVITVGFYGIHLEFDAAAISENGGSANATVSRFESTGDLVVNLSSDDTSEATVPPSVTLLDGQISANFTISAQDDAVLDGNQTVTITATSAGNPDETDTIEVTDEVPFTLTLVTGPGGDATTGGGAKDPDVTTHAVTTSAAPGFQFVNWTVTAGSATINDANAQNTTITASADATVQANFTPIIYTLVYNGNGNEAGSVPNDTNSSHNSGSTVTVSGNTNGLTKAGYDFVGWNTAAAGSGTGYIENDTFTITDDVTLYAQWNRAPVANDQSISTVRDNAVPITLTASDADGDTLSYAVATQPTDGILSGTAPNLLYTPSSGFNGSDSFTFTANDGTVDSNTATVSITVQTPFEDWAGAGNNPSGDSNGDGVSDGIAWVLGANDSSSDATAMLPEIDVNSDPDYLMFTYRRNAEAHNDSGTTIDVIYSDDLSTWTEAADTDPGVTITEDADHYGAGFDRVEVRISWDLITNDKLFTRLRVEITQ